MVSTPSSRTQRGGTLFGLIAGLLIGLLVAMLVAVYISKAPVPFVKKASRTPATAQQPVDVANAPDPNRSLYGKDGPAGTPSGSTPAATEPAPAPVPEARRADPLGDLIARTPGLSVPVPAAPPANGKPAAQAQPQPQQQSQQQPQPAQPPVAAADASGTYFLQVGAYRVIEDAEALKAKVAFLGLQARLESSDLPAGGTINRVRVGPFSKLDDMNRARSRLADNGIQAVVVKK
jgi:cell division protein FtsN